MGDGIKTIEISGVWLRKSGIGAGAKIQVLAEVDGQFRLLREEKIDAFTDGEVSHIIEPLGIRDAPRDPLDASHHIGPQYER